MNAIVFSATVSLLISCTNGQIMESPCPHIFKYEKQTDNDRWQGVLELTSREGIEGIWLNILLDSKADVLINTFGPTLSSNNQNFAINNPDYILRPGGSLRVRFTIKYNPDKPIPNVANINLRGIEICRDIRAPGNGGASNVVSDGNNIEMCGKKPQARPPVYNGHKAEGPWPWHTAIMILKNSNFDYHCGGSLITNQNVLTAAHCVTQLPTNKVIDKDMFVVYLGTTHLADPGPSFKLKLVESISVHNEYDPVRYQNDLAIIGLSDPVEFNDFIRPICLWDDDQAIRDLVGQYGTVVGWIIDNSGKIAPDLMERRMPVVGLETCLYYDRNFYSQFTSPKTFCAGGGANGSTACKGDSGGGLVFPKPGTTGKDQVWYIRGIVFAIPKDSGSVCNTKGYAILTDVAQHLDWIKQTTNLK